MDMESLRKIFQEARKRKSCGYSMPLSSGKISKTYQHRVGVSVSERKFMTDGIKAAFRHKLPRAMGSWI